MSNLSRRDFAMRAGLRPRQLRRISVRVLLARVSILSVCVFAVAAAPARGQSPTLTSVPRLVRVTSSFRPADGQPPAPVETMTLSIYGEETGGVPLWQETQSVAVNPDGRFTLLLGSTRPEGLPLDLFASGEPLWLAIHVERPGEGEPGRVLLAREAATKPRIPELDQGRLQDRDFRGGQAGRLFTPGAAPGARYSVFSGSEVRGRIFESTLDINARQSMLGVLFTGPKIGNFQSGGRISAVFFDSTRPGGPQWVSAAGIVRRVTPREVRASADPGPLRILVIADAKITVPPDGLRRG